MRKPNSTLTAAQVYRYAVQTFQPYLKLFNAKGGLAETILLAAAARISSLSDTCQRLRGVSGERIAALDSTREGMVEGFTQGNSLLQVDFTGRLFREGKGSISCDLAGVFARLGSDGASWLLKLSGGRLLGRDFALRSNTRCAEIGVIFLRFFCGERTCLCGE
ncbi:hypothetical protein [Singulisphaera acidiphila]|uniref:Uncharacterized protein n=1 Tax=Singulisphaera acidiphila (strain ATCC BAA-1392 / DSM 18658 / VKM B-2454 / MOB10) TaxID=886293 RepID=L0DI81_SINAD|nr:hypothetical protein [Singulisphaera acidiphila]AGA28565.1 hypothetical protein Sinac_4369 [Singulisphaera acidiphila DSM 18658]